MTPGIITPLAPKRIVLEEQVVFSIVIHQAVRVIAPVECRSEMKLRAEQLCIAFWIFQHFSQTLLIAAFLPGRISVAHLRCRANMV